MEVERISRECIKPSSPTPLHLKTYKFSLLDQQVIHHYVPTALYYPLNPFYSTDNTDNIVSTRLRLLKQSLSETLSHHYPLAGRIKDKFSIDCNDEGIYFVEARAKSATLNEFLNYPYISLISKFVPEGGHNLRGQIEGAPAGMVQVTSFACGGLVICQSVSHLFGDATTFCSILKCWAATTRRSIEDAVFPNYDASSLFPQIDAYPKEAILDYVISRFLTTGKVVSRRVLFDANAIANLKSKVARSSVHNPTRVEVVSALLSKCLMAAYQTKSGFHEPTSISQVVNLRRKAMPQFSEHLVGNIIGVVNTLCTDEKVELHGLVIQLREEIRKKNSDFVKSLQGDGGPFNLFKAVQDYGETFSKAKNKIVLSSWCNMGFYDVDFGWGNPIWMSYAGFDETVMESSVEYVVFMDTRMRDGIEAWLFLLEENMALLEVDKELLAFATFDPSPLS